MDDSEALTNILTDRGSISCHSEPIDQTNVDECIASNIVNYGTYRHGLWAMVAKDGDRLIGDFGITLQRIGHETVPEIGFLITEQHWNQGYATEAGIACRSYAFTTLDYPKIFLCATLKNIPAQEVAQALGMLIYKVFERQGEQQIAQVALNTAGS